MKRLIVFLLAFASAASACAQTVTVSGSLLSDSRGRLATGMLTWRPTLADGTPTGYHKGGGGQASSAPIVIQVNSGVFQLTLPDSALTAPANICFSLTLSTAAGGNLGNGYSCIQPTANNYWCTSGVCNFDNYLPALAALPIYGSGVTIDGVSGNWTFTGVGVSCNMTTLSCAFSGGGSSAWGGITGTLASQTDLAAALAGKQAALGFTPYNATNPAGYISSSALAPYALSSSLGTAAAQNTSAFDAAGAASTAQAASLQKSSNLSDLVSAATARTNLGLGTAATQASSAFDASGAAAAAQAAAIAASDASGSAAAAQAASLQKSSNLSDLASASTARTNLGLGTLATESTLLHSQLPALVSGDIPANAANTSGTAGGLSANIAESQVTNLTTDLAGKQPSLGFTAVPNTTTVNGHALSSNIVVPASDLTTGTLPHAQLPSLVSGDIPANAANTSGTAAGLSANIAESQVTNLTTDLAGKQASLGFTAVPNTVTVNGHALSSNVVVSASDLTTGTLPHAQLPSLVSGDIPANAANTSGTAANLSGTPALPSGTTATTQSLSDNSTKLATTAYVANPGTISGAQVAITNQQNLSMFGIAQPTSAVTLALGTSGVLTGTYYYMVVYGTAAGLGYANTAYISASISPSAQRVVITNIPISASPYVTSRNVYRSTASGDQWAMQLVTTLSDDVTTTYTDNIADGSLGQYMPWEATGFGATTISGLGTIRADGMDALFQGYNSGPIYGGYASTFIGPNSGFGITSGERNVGVGDFALGSDSTGSWNTGLGVHALGADTTGAQNTAVGFGAAQLTVGGATNTAVGFGSLSGNVSGGSNTAMGFDSLLVSTVNGLTAFGYNALTANTTGTGNAADGYSALAANVSGADDTALGYQALTANTSSSNTAVGWTALAAVTGGGGNTAIGAGAAPSVLTGGNNDTYIGASTVASGANVSNETVLGNGVTGKGSNTVTIGSSAVTDNYLTGNLHTTKLVKGSNTQLLTSDVGSITATTAATGTVVFTWGALPVSTNFSWHCAGTYTQATAAGGVSLAVQGATNAPTRIDAWGTLYSTNPASTTVTGTQAGTYNLTSTTATLVAAVTPGATGTQYQWSMDGTVQVGASATTLNIIFFSASGSDAVAVKAGSHCALMP